MTDAEERAYLEGQCQVWTHLLTEAMRHLPPLGSAARWALERAETVAVLRRLCALHGDNDWPDTLALSDILEKHLWNYLSP